MNSSSVLTRWVWVGSIHQMLRLALVFPGIIRNKLTPIHYSVKFSPRSMLHVFQATLKLVRVIKLSFDVLPSPTDLRLTHTYLAVASCHSSYYVSVLLHPCCVINTEL